MDLGLKDKKVIVTGGSKGIGLATARSFSEEDAEVVIVGRDSATLDAAAEALRGAGHSVTPFAADLSSVG